MAGRRCLPLAAVALWFAFSGCKERGSGADTAQADERPTLRLYLISDLAGALEPCGCVRDQRGGVDHLAAWLQSDRGSASASMLAAAGPLFFTDDNLQDDRADQDRGKADALARILHAFELAAFAPGSNDWVEGEAGLAARALASGAAIVASDMTGRPPPFASAIVKDAGAIKVGFVGVGQGPPEARLADEAGRLSLVKQGVEAAKRRGASVVVALAAVGRDEAKRIASSIPELTAVVVGSPSAHGESNASVPEGERVGGVVIAQGGNHLQAVGVLDLYVRDRVTPGRLIRFADATGLDRAGERAELAKRLDALHEQIAVAEREKSWPPQEIEARSRDLAALEAQRTSLDAKPPPEQGSFFRYSLKEIRPSMGKDTAIHAQMVAYYERVNQNNQSALAGRMPKPPAAQQASYVGVAVCARCHAPAFRQWKHTWHANAYGTLRSLTREFNLECVGCHVTGYDIPGGSTVTHVDLLENVQCEACHGPGSRHVEDPTDEKATIAKPDDARCRDCHHPPHVEELDATANVQRILGPGHGMPMKK